jgi:uncharacterized protein
MSRDPRTGRIEDRARELMKDALPSHGWDHVERVRKLALRIAAVEDADRTVVELAAILHDIGRKEEDDSRGTVCHAEISARLARSILADEGFAADLADHVCACILSHRFRKNRPPESLEARVLFDADKLDSIGAVGIGRAFLFAGEVGARLHNPGVDLDATSEYGSEDSAWREFSVKLRFIRDRMLTGEGRAIAEGRHHAMEEFFDRLHRETEARD